MYFAGCWCQNEDEVATADVITTLCESPGGLFEVLPDSQAFKATLRRSEDAPLGFRVEEVPVLDILVITELDGTPADDRIQSGDYILSVCGTSGAENMLALLERQSEVEATVAHPFVFTACVPRGGRRLGVELLHIPAGVTLFAGAIEADGAVAANGVDLKPGDRFIEVSGHTTRASMLEAFVSSDAPEFKVSRPPGSGAEAGIA